jgi:ABC-2 type transport system permease protein
MRLRVDALVAFATANRAMSRRAGSTMLALFMLPVGIMLVIGIAIGGYSEPVLTVGILDRAQTSESLALVAAVDADESLRVRAYDDEALMRAATFRGRLAGGLVVPPDWKGEDNLEIYLLEATAGAPVLRALLEGTLSRPGAAEPVPVRVLGGGREGGLQIGFDYTAPANLVLFVLINAITSSFLILALRPTGLSRRLLASPVGRTELLLGLVIGPAQLMTMQALFLIGIGWLAFGVDWGDPLGLLLVTTSLVALGTALVPCMATLFREPEQAISLGPLIGIVLGMLGGCMWPLETVPAAMRTFGHLFPTAWALDAYLALIFDDVGVREILPNVGVVLAMAALLASIGFLRLRREFAR